MEEAGEEGDAWAKGVLNDVAFEVVAYLGALQHVRDVVVRAKPPISAQQATNWERSNFPHKLSEELRDFYRRINGFELSWSAGINGAAFPVGGIVINSIEKLKAAPVAHLAQANKPGSNPVVASFVIEELEQGAKVLVAFRQQSEAIQTTEVWLWDPAIKASKIADSFVAYLRLAVLHLGIAKWQWAFTRQGLPARSQHWMRLLCPHRLLMDFAGSSIRLEMEHATSEAEGTSASPRQAPGQSSTHTAGFRLNLSSLPEDKDSRAAEKPAKPKTPKSARDGQSRAHKSRR